MKKIVCCYGQSESFDVIGQLSGAAHHLLTQIKGHDLEQIDIARDDKDLIEVVLQLGKHSGKLKIVEIPENIEWEIKKTGRSCQEFICEKEKIWGFE